MTDSAFTLDPRAWFEVVLSVRREFGAKTGAIPHQRKGKLPRKGIVRKADRKLSEQRVGSGVRKPAP